MILTKEKVKSETSFQLPEEGHYIITISKVEWSNEGKDNQPSKGWSARFEATISDAIEHAECVGIAVRDFFPIYTDFGFERFVMTAAIAMPKFPFGKEILPQHFNEAKTRAMFEKQLVGCSYPAFIKLEDYTPKGTDKARKQARVGRMTREDYDAILADAKKTSNVGIDNDKAGSTSSQASEQEDFGF